MFSLQLHISWTLACCNKKYLHRKAEQMTRLFSNPISFLDGQLNCLQLKSCIIFISLCVLHNDGVSMKTIGSVFFGAYSFPKCLCHCCGFCYNENYSMYLAKVHTTGQVRLNVEDNFISWEKSLEVGEKFRGAWQKYTSTGNAGSSKQSKKFVLFILMGKKQISDKK